MGRLLLTVGNVAGFHLVWLASIGGAGTGVAWAGPAAAAVFVTCMLAFGGRRTRDLRMLAIALPLGFVLDSLFAASGWLVYAEAWPWESLAPAWICSLWAGFAMTLNHSMAFLHGRTAAAALFGMGGGPLAYWTAAEAFGALSFGVPASWALAAISLGWALVLPSVFALDRRLAPPAPAGPLRRQQAPT